MERSGDTTRDAAGQPSTADEILDFLASCGDLPTDANPQTLIKQGWKASRQERPDIAHHFFVAAAASARKTKDTSALGRALTALADNAFHYFPDATADLFYIRETLSHHAEGLLRSAGDGKGLAESLRVKASIVPGAKGRELLEESFRICQRLGDPKDVVRSLERLGTHVGLYGNAPEAQAIKRQAIDIARVLNDQELIADLLFSLAIKYDGSQNERQAVLDEAQLIYGKLGRKSDQARCLLFCAELACGDSDYDGRSTRLEKAVRIAREAGDRSLCGTCLKTLIDVLRSQGGNLSRIEALEEEQKATPYDEVPAEFAKELEGAFATSDPEASLLAVRRAFGGKPRPQIHKKCSIRNWLLRIGCALAILPRPNC
ncbi:MAG: hypothetical protein AB7O38_02450 [Pirellulaceae bacterium]